MCPRNHYQPTDANRQSPFSVRLYCTGGGGGVDSGAGGSCKPPTELWKDGKDKSESETPRDPANNPARFAVASKTWTEPLGAWRLGARADDGHVHPSRRTHPSLAADEHVVKEVRQSAKIQVVQKPTPIFLYLFSVVLLAIVLVSHPHGSPKPFIFHALSLGAR